MRRSSKGLAVLLTAGGSIFPLTGFSQEAIIIARHSDPPPVLRIDEIRDDTPLSESGRQRAMMLAGRLKDSGISAIYVSEALRTAQTAEPLAQLLGLQSQVHLGDDVEGLVKRLHSDNQGKRVLVVGHWSTIPAILKALGHPQDVAIERSAYDNLFIVVPQGEQAPPTVVRLHY
ncbi:SixA phosphatase family protein [Microvirga zambiensis]|uniref:SixA phosphatase family protein n=1 Tax=Microvirga zambiensis TaxID=1402137 RepID=UPI00191D20BD|nr:phosphoglycerate mutase family protein [Microvirga zambiensis]